MTTNVNKFFLYYNYWKIAISFHEFLFLFSEKSRLESNYQEDKKKLRAELNDRDQTILNLKQEVKQFREKYRTEIDDAKSKLIIERHNR